MLGQLCQVSYVRLVMLGQLCQVSYVWLVMLGQLCQVSFVRLVMLGQLCQDSYVGLVLVRLIKIGCVKLGQIGQDMLLKAKFVPKVIFDLPKLQRIIKSNRTSNILEIISLVFNFYILIFVFNNPFYNLNNAFLRHVVYYINKQSIKKIEF